MPPELRPSEETDAAVIASLLADADDARVISVETVLYSRRTRPERARILELLAVDAGDVVGGGIAGANIYTSTENAAFAFVTVAPNRRREGIGSSIADALLSHLHELGPKQVTTFVRQTDEGERWANARGFERAITGPLIAVDPRNVPEPEPPRGFRWVLLSDLEPEDVYEAMTEAALDEPSPTPNDRISFDDFLRDWNDPDFDRSSSAAVVEDGKVVAFSFMKVAGDRGQHGFTGCLRAYRGRGLATTAKRAALRAAAVRGVTRVTTSNAEENVAMRAINRRLGFEPIGEHLILTRDL